MTGTTIAQAIPIAISPILTRMYSPESFGVLAIFISVATVISVIANLRYQLAIVQPKKDEDAAAIVILSMIIAAIISSLSLVIIIIFNQDISLWLDSDLVGSWLYLTPISVLVFGIYQPMNYWFVRKQYYKNIATSKVSQGAFGGLAQLILGPMSIGPLGLISGHIIGQVTALIVLIKSFFNDYQSFKTVKLNKVTANMTQYKRLPKYSAPGAVINSLSAQMPNFFIARYFDLVATGFFGLVFRVLNVPLALISGALGQVLLQRLANGESGSKQVNNERIFLFKIFLILLIIILPFVLIIRSYGEEIFAIIFGEEWRVAGEMAGIVVIAIAIRFSVSPLSAVMALERNIKMGVAWQFFYLGTLSFTLMYFSNYPLLTFLKAFVIHELILYLLYLVIILNSVTRPIDSK